jgi:hypothetical protein
MFFKKNYLCGIAMGIIIAIAVVLQGFQIERILLIQSLVLILVLACLWKSYARKISLTVNWLLTCLTILWIWQIASLWFGICFPDFCQLVRFEQVCKSALAKFC